MEQAGAPAGWQIRLEPFQEPAGVPATPRARLAQRACARVGRNSIPGRTPRIIARAPALCAPWRSTAGRSSRSRHHAHLEMRSKSRPRPAARRPSFPLLGRATASPRAGRRSRVPRRAAAGPPSRGPVSRATRHARAGPPQGRHGRASSRKRPAARLDERSASSGSIRRAASRALKRPECACRKCGESPGGSVSTTARSSSAREMSSRAQARLPRRRRTTPLPPRTRCQGRAGSRTRPPRCEGPRRFSLRPTATQPRRNAPAIAPG